MSLLVIYVCYSCWPLLGAAVCSLSLSMTDCELKGGTGRNRPVAAAHPEWGTSSPFLSLWLTPNAPLKPALMCSLAMHFSKGLPPNRLTPNRNPVSRKSSLYYLTISFDKYDTIFVILHGENLNNRAKKRRFFASQN